MDWKHTRHTLAALGLAAGLGAFALQGVGCEDRAEPTDTPGLNDDDSVLDRSPADLDRPNMNTPGEPATDGMRTTPPTPRADDPMRSPSTTPTTPTTPGNTGEGTGGTGGAGGAGTGGGAGAP